MIYGELFIPYVADGLMIRVGRYISLPDIEAQLAPNNYMYTHSFTYGYDNYTNEGIIGTVFAITKNFIGPGGRIRKLAPKGDRGHECVEDASSIWPRPSCCPTARRSPTRCMLRQHVRGAGT